MFTCKYCSKEGKTLHGNTYHENRCPKNVNKVQHNWTGRKHNILTLKKLGQKNPKGLRTPLNIFDMSRRTKCKVIKRLNIGCSQCGWNKASGDLHHIIERCNGGTDDHSNLTYVCPNCHRLAHDGLITEFVTFEKQVGDSWKEHYFAKE